MDLIEEYICTHSDAEPDLLKELSRDAHVHLLRPRMIAGHLQGRLLKMFVRMICPKHVLEIGTYTGYSAICLAEGLTEEGHLDTIEIDDEMEEFIRKYLNRSSQKEKISLHIGDALDIIPTFEDDFFDLVFIDADKRKYEEYFEAVFPKVCTGGFIIADNTLWNGKVLTDAQHADPQTKGILAFNNRLAKDDRVEKVILPVRDGLTLIRKK
ncbi:O-methyltransferase [Anaerorudis cellulosivorans]|uniref:O-methyltransferase n=1 Tax=Anaerorudis cellulosivorans TaxID=3397862 RepID=UPI00221FEC3E|nr:O-methyltransferase [Seramator thermalis]MCW1734390.1 O-methyltransferase [Seramator thermalis]